MQNSLSFDILISLLDALRAFDMAAPNVKEEMKRRHSRDTNHQPVRFRKKYATWKWSEEQDKQQMILYWPNWDAYARQYHVACVDPRNRMQLSTFHVSQRLSARFHRQYLRLFRR